MKNISRQPTPNKAVSTRIARPWLWVAVLAILLLGLMALGSWRACGTGAQGQVAMF